MSEDGRRWGLCCVHVDDFLVALDKSESETRQHFDALKQQFQREEGREVMRTLPSVACTFVKTLCTTSGAKFA